MYIYIYICYIPTFTPGSAAAVLSLARCGGGTGALRSSPYWETKMVHVLLKINGYEYDKILYNIIFFCVVIHIFIYLSIVLVLFICKYYTVLYT